MAAEIEHIWKKLKTSPGGEMTISLDEIRVLKNRKAKGFFSKLIITIRVSAGMKIILGLGLGGLIILANTQPDLYLLLVLLIITCAGLIAYDLSLVKTLSILSSGTERTSSLIRRINRFLSIQFSTYQLIGALTNPILVLTGVLFYQHFKRDMIGFQDVEDIVVTLIFLCISYIISLFGNRYTRNSFQSEIADLERIEDQPVQVLRVRKKKKIISTIIFLLILLAGLVLFLKLALR